MRYVAFALLMLTGILGATQARATPGMTFGGFYCSQHLVCSQSDPAFPSPDNLVAMANGCVSRNVGLVTPSGGFFDPNAGLDSKGCLTTISDAFSSLGSLRSIPQCCVMPAPSGTGCAISCTMVGQ